MTAYAAIQNPTDGNLKKNLIEQSKKFKHIAFKSSCFKQSILI